MREEFRKLHLGCGSVFIPGFTHVDVAEYDHVDYLQDVRDLSFIPENSAELVYSSHVLEHFGRWEVGDIIKEWYRVISPDGILRLAVPDFAACAKLYYEQGLRDGLSGLIGLVSGGQKDQGA